MLGALSCSARFVVLRISILGMTVERFSVHRMRAALSRTWAQEYPFNNKSAKKCGFAAMAWEEETMERATKGAQVRVARDTNWPRLAALLPLIAVAAFAAFAIDPAAARDWRRDWATLHNERHGFLIAYPVDIFAQRAEPSTDEGRILYSLDGEAQLLVGAFANDEGMTMLEYRAYLVDEQYRGARIEYAPVRDKWFVLSGTIGEQEFYERVSFTCDGRLINSWAMLYPRAKNRFYDRVVEAIARTYTPGAGRSGNCD